MSQNKFKETIHPLILENFTLNEAQKQAISITEGPLLIIAGPGSGKTFVLVLRALNILLNNLAKPEEIVLCTFTEKSAYELRDRLSMYAQKISYSGNLSELKVGTIHGISNDFILRYRHFTKLGNNYEVLDDLTQLLFLFDNFSEVISDSTNDDEKYLNKWMSKWGAIENITKYFNKITEELINFTTMSHSKDKFVKELACCYDKYLNCLSEKNKLDFSLIQKHFYDLLNHHDIRNNIVNSIKYVLVDEYQDTNFIQEQLLLKLSSVNHNICVVGDEDQSLYRFRGATVRNILEFPKHFEFCSIVKMTINYRSHQMIIDKYNKFMQSWDWKSDIPDVQFRFDKEIKPDPDNYFPDYPSVFSIWGENEFDEGNRFADFIVFLKDNNIIKDYNQVALLLHSVRLDHSGKYTDALEKKGVPYFCPRQRGFFETEEIRSIVACFAIVLEFYGEKRGEAKGNSLRELYAYVDEALSETAKNCSSIKEFTQELQFINNEIGSLSSIRTLDKRLADYFYQLISIEPFLSFVQNENRSRNLAIFSQLLNIFQNYYHFTVITAKNLSAMKLYFFNSFLRLLYEGGINEFEDPYTPFPKGFVQVMTIHQSKGLEFPVVVVGSLNKTLSSQKEIDKILSPFYHRPIFEPPSKITGFDRMRLHYVAFSRPEKILVLTSSEKPKDYFNPILQGLDQWPYVDKELFKSLSFEPKTRFIPKKKFSFTSDLSVYQNCPRQYLFFNELEFNPSRSAEMFFGSLIHQTIEDIHRDVLIGKLNSINDTRIRNFFDFNYKHLLNSGMRAIDQSQKELAFKQVLNYFHQNKEEMKTIIETEVDVSLEKDIYILTGKIDLLSSSGDMVDILDFKSMKKPDESAQLLDSFQKQLSLYGHIIEKRYHKTPDNLILYWTSEERKEDAMMKFKYDSSLVNSAVQDFDAVVKKILNKDFHINDEPAKKVCRECDLKHFCTKVAKIKGA